MLDSTLPDNTTPPHPRPDTPAAAIAALMEGNRAFSHLLAEHSADGAPAVMHIPLEDLGLSRPGVAPRQQPFAAFLGCADARAPVELIFGQAANNLFVVRVAGNILDAAGLGSLNFAVERLGTVRLLCVLGHTGCGAASAAVDAYLAPASYLGVGRSAGLLDAERRCRYCARADQPAGADHAAHC